jgi:predicted transglutaminase-like cysteine proteinase
MMSGFGRSADLARALAFVLSFSFGVCDQAAARPHGKKSHQISGPAVATISPPSSPTSARFFTINQIMARREGRVEPTEPFRLADAIPTDRTSDAPIPAPSKPKSSDEPFGLLTFRAPEGPLWVKWRAIEAEMKTEENVLDQCRVEPDQCASAAARHYLAFVDETRRRVGRARGETINNLVNDAIRYSSDLEQHGVIDVWMAPLATLASGRGDCKDYAIAKYFALRDAGTAPEDLRLLLVRDLSVRQDHAVVAIRADGRWLILDNRYSRLLDAAEAHQFVPLFAIDYQGVKLFAAPYAERPLDATKSEAMSAGEPLFGSMTGLSMQMTPLLL